VSLFAPADLVQLQGVAELAFHDDYVLLRKPDTATKDTRGNRTNATATDFDVIEAGKGRLRREGLQPFEGIRADRLSSTVTLSFDLPLDTLATAKDLLRVNGREFQITGVIREGALGMVTTAKLEERS
jgi:hypothetical protein